MRTTLVALSVRAAYFSSEFVRALRHLDAASIARRFGSAAFVLLGSLALPAVAQTGVADQLSPFPPIFPPGTSGGLGAFLTTQIFDQEVRIGVHGTLEGFRCASYGDPGATVTVRVRPGPVTAPGPAVFTTVLTRVGSVYEEHWVDASSAALHVTPGMAVTLEFQGMGSIFYVGDNHVDPALGPPLYPFPFFVNGASFADGGYRLAFETFTLTTPGSFVYYCRGDGTGTPCPCGNNSPIGNPMGCLNSMNTGGVLRLAGSASVGADTLSMNGFSMPNSTALYLQGTLTEQSGLGSVLGDGLVCVGGSIVRLGSKTNVAGQSHYPEPANPSISVRGGCSAGDVRNYQIWYRNAANYCTPATANLTNGAQVVWAP